MWGVTTTTAGAVPADQERKSPGRPRSARADEAIIEAVLDLLADGTLAEEISIEAVAARAGVGKATIYRRWSNKDALLVDAVATIKGEPPKLAGTSIRDDLVTLLRPIAAPADTRAGKIMPCLLSAMHRSPSLSKCFQKITEPRRELMRQVLARGVAAGELRADLDFELVTVMLVGPLVSQALIGWNPSLDRATLPERLVDTLWPAIVAP
ncbi:MAG: TetR family transcriptional regulator [Actinobacteria bacterium 13_2_20CM_2_72_6]|nr:MAG: TetR family transcriptional regulator [Actinobacteria bacterium 13_2_20CM_2_72_6]